MKKTLKRFFFATTIIFIVGFSNGFSSCPPGYTEFTITATYTYGGYFTCDYTIVYCCKWDNNIKHVVAQIEYFYSTYNYCMFAIPDWTNFVTWLQETVGASADISCAPPYPPCDDPNQVAYFRTVSTPLCWYYENYQKYPGDDFILRLVRCEHEYNECITTWKICLDYSIIPAVLRIIFISKQQTGQPDCPSEEPKLPPEDSHQWQEHWITSCFSHPC